MTATPQDHLPKAADDVYTFTVGNKTHRLPSAAEATSKISGRALRDAAMAGEEGQLRLGFSMLEASGADEAALDALYDMPAGEMLEHIKGWMEYKSGGAASLGESSSSSA